MGALEASLGGHKSVINPDCPWDTTIVIHCLWKASLRWCATTRYSVRVGLQPAKEFTFCSAQLPSWVNDDTFEQAIGEIEAGPCRAGGSIFLGVDANCDVDNVDNQRGGSGRVLLSRPFPPCSRENGHCAGNHRTALCA